MNITYVISDNRDRAKRYCYAHHIHNAVILAHNSDVRGRVIDDQDIVVMESYSHDVWNTVYPCLNGCRVYTPTSYRHKIEESVVIQKELVRNIEI